MTTVSSGASAGELVDRRVEVHHLDDAEVIEGAHRAREHADHREDEELRLDGREEHVPLGEEAGERRQADQREHQDGDHRGDEGPGLRQPGEFADGLDRAGLGPQRQDAGEEARRVMVM